MIWQWNNTTHKRQLRLSTGDKTAIAKEKSTAPLKKMLEIRHMAERCLEIPVSKDSFIWIFYLPDFTRIFKDWYRMYLDNIFELYQPDARAILVDEGKWLTLKYAGERPIQIIRQMLAAKDFDSVSQLMKKADEAEKACRSDLNSMEFWLRTGTLPAIPRKAVNSMNRFAAFALNNVYPDRYFHENFPLVDLNRLLTSKISSWKILYDKSVELLEPVYAGIYPEEQAVSEYAQNFSFIRWGDICSSEDDSDYSLKMIRDAKSSFQNYSLVWNYLEHQKEERRLDRMEDAARHSYVKKVLEKIPPAQKNLFTAMEKMAAKAQRYNEMRRLFFTRFLKIIRSFCENKTINWKNASLEKIVGG